MSGAGLLIAGGRSDPNLIRLQRRASLREIETAPLLWGAAPPPIRWSPVDGVLRRGDAVVAPAAAFIRQDVFRFAASGAEADRTSAQGFRRILDGWLSANPQIRVFNRNFLGRDAVNKPYALWLAARHGLRIPATAIGADPQALRDMAADAPAVVKPVGGGGFCEPLDAFSLARPPAGIWIAQRRIAGPDLRVFLIGDRALAFHIASHELDYRRDPKPRIVRAPAPAALIAPLSAFARALGLDFAAADFKDPPDGEGPVFLEINSNPMFAAFDVAARGALCDAMLDWLTVE